MFSKRGAEVLILFVMATTDCLGANGGGTEYRGDVACEEASYRDSLGLLSASAPDYLMVLDPRVSGAIIGLARELSERSSAHTRNASDATVSRMEERSADDIALPREVGRSHLGRSSRDNAAFWIRRSEFCLAKRALDGQADNFDASYIQAILFVAFGDPKRAMQLLERRHEASNRSGSAIDIGSRKLYAELAVLLSRGEAVDQLERLAGDTLDGGLEVRAVQFNARLLLAAALLRSDRPEQAFSTAGSVELESRDSNRALILAGWAKMNIGQPTKALVYWREVAARQGDDAEIYDARALIPRALWAAAGRQAAVAAYEENLSLFASEIQRIALTIVAIESGQLDGAMLGLNPCGPDCTWFDDIVAPTDWPFRVQLARAIAENQFQEAFRELRASLGLFYWLDDLEEAGYVLSDTRLSVADTVAKSTSSMTRCVPCLPAHVDCQRKSNHMIKQSRDCSEGYWPLVTIADLKGYVSGLVEANRSRLRGLAVAALHAQQARLELHMEQALLAIAQIHDIVSMQPQNHSSLGVVPAR